VCRLRLADAYVLESASPQVYTLSYTTLFRSRRRLVEADPQLGLLRRKAQEAPLAHQSADAADPQAVALRGAVHLVQVHQPPITQDRKSTRLNSSHVKISYAVFCLKKKSSMRR